MLKNCLERVTVYSGAAVVEAPKNSLRIKVVKSVTDLNRIKPLSYSTSYLYAKDQNAIFPLNSMHDDASGTDVIA